MIWVDTVWQTLVRWWPEILQGTIIGVSASVMISLLNSISSKINEYKQVRHLSKLINKYINDISDVDDDENHYEEFKVISEQFQHELKLFALTRLRYLSIHKRGEFQLAQSSVPAINFINKEGYLNRCEPYKKLEWVEKRLGKRNWRRLWLIRTKNDS